MIDIGGPTLLRSSSKNFGFLTTICNPGDYSKLIKNLDKNNGKTSYEFRKKMAFKVFKNTSYYDSLIYKWLKSTQELKNNNKSKKIFLKYGENPNQKSYFIKSSSKSIFDGQIQGNKIGYNNILDISEGLACLTEFKEPTCVIIKHNNPCSVASDTKIKKSFIKAYQADSISAFGGVVLFNRKINKNLSLLLKKYFFEIIVAPDFYKNSIKIFETKKNLILIRSKNINSNNKEFKTVASGILFQNKNNFKITRKSIKLVSSKNANFKTVEDLLFAFKVAKHVKSNAIVLANNKQTVGIGAGQMSRIDSTRLALMKYKDNFLSKTFVCASDAFFPFADNIKLLKKNNCSAIIQPLGSKNDQKIIDFSKQNKIPLYFTKNRVFKH
jgi:phosphoribosylaminoimidazolecarboxamide formyltransferase/IMP cyclohydrolase